MATNFLVHEKIWFDKFKYGDAERRFYEQMNGPVCASCSWTGWCGGAPSWCPWATVSGSCRFSVWWRTRWGQTCWRRRSPSLKSVCRVSTSQLSTRSGLSVCVCTRA
uniref:Translation elongation factor EF1B beta/delta subunit guanine nucleotide exchange domain-containing protein n=1 Tax=Nomascus leucogenys TaxID=61853 RepID=A0A2I3GZ21_NOMLE